MHLVGDYESFHGKIQRERQSRASPIEELFVFAQCGSARPGAVAAMAFLGVTPARTACAGALRNETYVVPMPQSSV